MPQVQGRSSVACLAVALCVVAVSGCGPGGMSQFRLHECVARPQPGVVIFLADGLAPRFVEQGCAEGWLPNIERYIRGRGARVENATTSMPAITYAAIATIMSGTSPARHGIVGNRWFDPDAQLFRNYVLASRYDRVDADYAAPLIYERIDPAPSATVQTVHRRGADVVIRNWALSGVMWAFKDYTAVDKLSASSIWRLIDWANWQRVWPTLVTFYFPGLDSVGHAHGASSPEYRRAGEHLDHQVGRVCQWLEREGLLDTTYLVLVSDHGMVDVAADGRVDVLNLVRGWGRQATDEMVQHDSPDMRWRFFRRFDTVVAHQDGRGVCVHFRGPDGWGSTVPYDAVEEILLEPPVDQRLWNHAGVDLVMYLAGPDEVVLRSGRGAARVQRRVQDGLAEYAYEPSPHDLLEYMADPELAAFVAAGFHDSRAWLRATARQAHPDVVPHVIPLLHQPRSGQVIAFAAPGYSFVQERGGHGGVHRDEMLMTFCIAGPGIAPGTVLKTARSVDLVPTLLELLEIEPADDGWLEGISLVQEGLLSAPERRVVP